ncbi:hypothetical protein VP1G_11205 [Cytospora mali]|uniref:Uncharacterized protein n=1 Tax=Cytospora mali TaxID=578113 RepID=A0A194V7R1_CYTMA|nr:hypothetical protein VP1G_11205 [Valsa mali var. pyri (nom. inval.)]
MARDREFVVLILLLGSGLDVDILVLVLIGLNLILNSITLVLDLLGRPTGSPVDRDGVGDKTARWGGFLDVIVIVIVDGALLTLALALARGGGLRGAGGARAAGLAGGSGGSTAVAVAVAGSVRVALAELLENLLGPLLGWASMGCQPGRNPKPKGMSMNIERWEQVRRRTFMNCSTLSQLALTLTLPSLADIRTAKVRSLTDESFPCRYKRQ